MSGSVDIRLMLPGDLSILHQISRDAYSLNFGHHWQEGGLEEYLEKVYGEKALAADLADPAIRYYVAFIERQPVAFMKLNLLSNLPDADPEKGIELDKLYVLPSCKGSGIGRLLLDWAHRLARQLGKEVFWLGVIDTNTAAIAFYEKAGFRRHSMTRVGYPKFREELKGMWRMEKKLSGNL